MLSRLFVNLVFIKSRQKLLDSLSILFIACRHKHIQQCHIYTHHILLCKWQSTGYFMKIDVDFAIYLLYNHQTTYYRALTLLWLLDFTCLCMSWDNTTKNVSETSMPPMVQIQVYLLCRSKTFMKQVTKGLKYIKWTTHCMGSKEQFDLDL